MSATPPLVLVHGAWHGPWCWDGVADDLRAAGHRVHVVELPGHDRPGDHRRIWATAGSYVEHLRAEVAGLDEPPVLVGHSMGGYVVQRYLEDERAAGAALVASVPRHGVLATTVHLLRSRPGPTLRAMATLDLWPPVSGAAGTALFLGDDPPAGVAEQVAANLQNESYLAFLAMLARWPRPSQVHTPCLVVAAEGDALFTAEQQHDLAVRLGCRVVTVPGGHDVMLDVGRPALVAALEAWLPTLDHDS